MAEKHVKGPFHTSNPYHIRPFDYKKIIHLNFSDLDDGETSPTIDTKDPLNKALGKFNQRTSGPVNAQLIPGPGIYFNAFIHVYSARAGADNPLGTNVDVNRKPLSLCPFVANFKTISLKYDFKHTFK